jgi:hypothetical protein
VGHAALRGGRIRTRRRRAAALAAPSPGTGPPDSPRAPSGAFPTCRGRAAGSDTSRGREQDAARARPSQRTAQYGP